VAVTNAIAGIGLAGQKQMVAVRHHVERQAKLGTGGARTQKRHASLIMIIVNGHVAGHQHALGERAVNKQIRALPPVM
jgi:hypothetical protein